MYDEYFIVRPPKQSTPSLASGIDATVTTPVSAAPAEALVDSFDTGFEGEMATYESSVAAAPVEATNSNFYDCGEVA